MKILLLWSFYADYLDKWFLRFPITEECSYESALRRLIDDGVSWPPALLLRCEALGCEVSVIVENCKPLQELWARENRISYSASGWRKEIVYEQIRAARPDVLWLGSMFQYFGAAVQEFGAYCKKIIAWVAVDPPPFVTLRGIDMILTSHANFVERFEKRGASVTRMLPSFEHELYARFKADSKDIQINFVGSLSGEHPARGDMVRRLQREHGLRCWSSMPRFGWRSVVKPLHFFRTARCRKIARYAEPPIFGADMYRVLSRSHMTFNSHIAAAGGLAGNMRMFEATGMKSALVTEHASNLPELFAVDTEVVAYANMDDLSEKVGYYLRHPNELVSIAQRGHERTVSKHSTIERAPEFVAICRSLF